MTGDHDVTGDHHLTGDHPAGDQPAGDRTAADADAARGRSRLTRGRVAAATVSLVTLAGGATLAAVPATVIVISARLFTTEEQGWIAVAVLLATYAGQLVSATVVESRLGSPGTDRRVVVPVWLTVAGLVAALVTAALPPDPIRLAVALLIMLAALETGRQVAIAERLDRRELAASVLIGLGLVVAVVAAILGQPWALVPFAVGVAGAIAARGIRPGPPASRADPTVRRWIVADTAVTGVVIPLLNSVILAVLGPTEAVLFAAISTASGVLAIPLNFMRTRLLKEHSVLDIVASGIAVAGAFAALLVLHLTGVLGQLFGAAWTFEAATGTLLVACAWRAASLATSVPFAALRRAGHARLVAVLRAVVSAMTFALAIGGVAVGGLLQPGGGLIGAFAGLLVAELVSAGVYEVARRRRTA